MGRAKALLRFGSETMLARVVRILSGAVSPIVVVAAAGQELPPLPDDVQIVHDRRPELGPLEGIAAGLAHLRAQSVEAAYITSCDVPLLKTAFVRRIVESLGSYELVMPRDGQYHHPLAAVYRTQVEQAAQSLVAQGRMRPLFLLEECRSRTIDVDELRDVDPQLESLQNLNTPDDYRRALERAGLG